MTTSTSSEPDRSTSGPAPARRFALVGNPNTGKTTLFNRLCATRAQTANFPGSTFSSRVARTGDYEIIDLPGHYGLNLDRPESHFCRDYLDGRISGTPRPDAVIIVVDATNLARNLIFASQALQQGLPAIVALTRIDLAQRRGLTIDATALSTRVGCPVVPICAIRGEGIEELVETMREPRRSVVGLPDPTSAQAASVWADEVASHCVGGDHAVGSESDTVTDRLDVAFTHPVLGTIVFIAVMVLLFYVIFTLAAIPMELIELAFAELGGVLSSVVPEGAVRSLLVDGVIGGVAGTLVFLPQICLLFFLISILEDSGYLARAAFVMDRLLRRFGLPGQSFVPFLSAHACAIPAIMSARLIPDRRDRLATILVAPFMSCAARLPVYVLLIGILFGDSPWLTGLAFAGCYILGAAAALFTAAVVRWTLLPGVSPSMVLELPRYKIPSLRTALTTTWDRAKTFVQKAGTVIVGICVVLWWLGAYPQVDPPAEATALVTQADTLETSDPDEAARLRLKADQITSRHASTQSFIGRIGRVAEPAFRPLGYDWQLTIGVMSSFAAREVFVSTMAVVLTGTEDDPAEDETVRERIINAERSDGTPVFTTATAASLLVFYIFAMQCLPTVEVTRRETGNWRWAALQLGWMSFVAYAAAFITYRLCLLIT